MNKHTYILNGFIALALLVLLALSALFWAIDLGAWGTPVGLAIAVIKAFLIGLFFMELRDSSGLTRLFAVAGIYWLAILISLSLADIVTR